MILYTKYISFNSSQNTKNISINYSIMIKQMTYKEVFGQSLSGKRTSLYPNHCISFVINDVSCGYLYKETKNKYHYLTNGIVYYPYDVDIDHLLVDFSK